MPGPLALRFIGACSPPACAFLPAFFCCSVAAADASWCAAGYALLLMSVAIAVLGSVVFVQDTWFS
jgi:hypothetical protein